MPHEALDMTRSGGGWQSPGGGHVLRSYPQVAHGPGLQLEAEDLLSSLEGCSNLSSWRGCGLMEQERYGPERR